MMVINALGDKNDGGGGMWGYITNNRFVRDLFLPENPLLSHKTALVALELTLYRITLDSL